jgi:hypothetical protein
MVKRDLADTLKYEGYIIRHDHAGRRRHWHAPFDEGKIMVTWSAVGPAMRRVNRSDGDQIQCGQKGLDHRLHVLPVHAPPT